MSKNILKAGILIISTTAAQNPSTDSSTDILRDVFKADGGGQWEVEKTTIVGDSILDIQQTIMQWTDSENPLNLIVTTGGTGFAVHDNTPEVRLSVGSFEHEAKCLGYYPATPPPRSWPCVSKIPPAQLFNLEPS
jgi:molybdopterin biosynthesis enzyme MoaB